MKISKTHFINILRCRRYIALYEIYKEKEDAVVASREDLELEELMGMENEAFKLDILADMYDPDTGEDLIKETNAQLEMMSPYYDELEQIAGRLINKMFKGNVIYNKDTFKQKRFSYLDDGYEFFCFLDGYQEDDDTIRIFETKATTSSKFSADKDAFYFGTPIEGSRKKKRNDFFVELPSGIYVPYEDLNTPPEDSDYYKKESRLFNRFDDRGAYIYDLAYQRYVIEKSLKTNKKVEYYLVVLNHEYTHDGKTDDEGKPVYNDNILRFYNLTSLTEKMMPILKEDFEEAKKRADKMDASVYPIGEYCGKGNNKCPFYDICYSVFPEEDSILTYTNRHHGFKDESGERYELFDLINNYKYVSALDVPYELLNRRNNQIQRDAIESNEPFYNKEKIRKGIELLKYPIYHLDFESFNAPLPRFKGEKPYMQSLFQYSIHIEKEPGVIDKEKDHYGFLAKDHKDRREELLKSMLDVIKPDGGTVLVYNVAFERGRLKELQELFPKYFDQLEDIIDRLFDLQDIIKGNRRIYKSLGFSDDIAGEYNYYHRDLQGSFSIKKVLPIFSELTYKGMEVGDGTEAMITYSSFPKMDKLEFERKYNALVEYCKQDTWAMYEILNKLREI